MDVGTIILLTILSVIVATMIVLVIVVVLMPPIKGSTSSSPQLCTVQSSSIPSSEVESARFNTSILGFPNLNTNGTQMIYINGDRLITYSTYSSDMWNDVVSSITMLPNATDSFVDTPIVTTADLGVIVYSPAIEQTFIVTHSAGTFGTPVELVSTITPVPDGMKIPAITRDGTRTIVVFRSGVAPYRLFLEMWDTR